MRKNKADDEGIKGMLRDEYARCLELVGQVRQAMDNYPKGRLVVKKLKVKGRVYEYHHLQWRDGEKIASRHVPEKELQEVQKQIEQREAYRANSLKLEKRLDYLAPLLGEKRLSKRNSGLISSSASSPKKNQPMGRKLLSVRQPKLWKEREDK